MKIRSVGAELFHADEQMDGRIDRYTYMTKLIVAFRNFSNAPKSVTTLFQKA
jgi:Fe-S-cluster formation regulator IscX/YfhJ